MFLDKKTLLKIWLNPGLNLTIFRVTGPRNTSSRNPDSHEVPMTNEIKWEKKVPIKKTGIQYLESRIHYVKSRIQDCHGFPRRGRNKGTGNQVHFHWQFNFIGNGQPRHEPRFHVLFLNQTCMTLIFYFQRPGQSWRIKPWLFGNLETVQTIRNWDVASNACYWVSSSQKGTRSSF